MNEIVVRVSQSAPYPPSGYELPETSEMMIVTDDGDVHVFGNQIHSLEGEFEPGLYTIVKVDT